MNPPFSASRRSISLALLVAFALLIALPASPPASATTGMPGDVPQAGDNVLTDCSGGNDPLDADTGTVNNCQNSPALTLASPSGTTQIVGTLNSTPSREFRIDFFASGDALPAGQGERFIGSATVTTDAGGDATIDVTLPEALSGATTITATATDLVTGDSSPFSNAVSASREVALAQGWNLVGWSGATPVREATAGLGESLLAAFTWDTTGQDFRSFRPTAPGFLNTLDELTLGDGVWANLSQATTWLQPPFAQARDVALAAGFNLVMWTGPDATPVADAVAGIAGNLAGLFLWDAIPQHFLIYRSNVPAALNSAKTLDYGVGVWLRMTQASIWSQPALAGPPPPPPEEEPAPFALTSTAFAANALIPAVYTCDGANTSPPLALTGTPADTVTLALIMDDPDAPGGTWVHWVAFNIAPTPLIEANIAALGTSGINSFGLTGYGGPCPPDGTHRYFFTVYALDAELALAPGASKAGLLAALDGHVLATAELVGLFR